MFTVRQLCFSEEAVLVRLHPKEEVKHKYRVDSLSRNSPAEQCVLPMFLLSSVYCI